MQWLTSTPTPLASPRALGFTAPGKADWIVLPMLQDELFVMAYARLSIVGRTIPTANLKEHAPRIPAADWPGAVVVLVADDHEACGTGRLVGWFKRLARERDFHVSVFFVHGLTAKQVLDQLKIEADVFLSRRVTRH